MPLSGVNTSLNPLQSDDTLTGVLQRLQDLYNQPLIPNNPMAQAGSIMSGFAAGVKGQPNPLVEQALERRKTAFSQMLGQANLALSMRREASLEQQRKDEKERAEKSEARLTKQFAATQAQNLLQAGLQYGKPDLIRRGAEAETAAGIVTWRPEQIEALVNPARREQEIKDKTWAAGRLLVNPLDAEAAAMDQALAKLAQDEEGRAKIRARFKIPDENLLVMKEENERQEIKLKAEQDKNKLLVAQGNTDLSVLVKSGRDFNKDMALKYAYVAKKEGTLANDPFLLDAYNSHMRETSTAVNAGEAARLLVEIRRAELDAKKKEAPWQDFDVLAERAKVLLKMVETITATDPKNTTLIPKLQQAIMDLSEDMVKARVREPGKVAEELKAELAAIEAAKKGAGKKKETPKDLGIHFGPAGGQLREALVTPITRGVPTKEAPISRTKGYGSPLGMGSAY